MLIQDEIEIITGLITTDSHVINREFFLNKLEEFKIEFKKELLNELKPKNNINIYKPKNIAPERRYNSNYVIKTVHNFEKEKYVPDTTDFTIDQTITSGTTWAVQFDYTTYIKKSTILYWLGHYPHKRRLMVKPLPYPKGSEKYNQIVTLARNLFLSYGIPFDEEKEIRVKLPKN